jgi:hypothetical protein
MWNYVGAAPMKNITLAIDEKVLKNARAYAKKRGTSLNALVRDYLGNLVWDEDRVAEARRGLLELIDKSTLDMGPDYKWNREELYADRVFPRHKRSDLRRGSKKAG